IILIITLLTYQPPVYEGYVYGSGAEMFGWFIACLPFLPIPFYAGFMLITTKGTPLQ
ncbi:sodium- and chloride-dependent glycine transporter 2, partial [Biomphalaria glabrata]